MNRSILQRNISWCGPLSCTVGATTRFQGKCFEQTVRLNIIKTHQDTHALSRRETTISRVQLTTEQYSTSNHTWVNTCQEANAINLKCGLRRTCSASLNHHLPKSSKSFRSLVVILMNHSQQHAVRRFIVNLYIIHFYITNFFHMFGSPTRKGLDKNIFSIHPRRQSLKVLKRKQLSTLTAELLILMIHMILSNKGEKCNFQTRTSNKHPNTMNKDMYGNAIESASEIIM